jgi:hypothetical protein
MSVSQTDELTEALGELRTLFPEWRLGQLIANLLVAAGHADGGAIWDVEDQQLLAAARRLMANNRDRKGIGAEPSGTPDRGMPLPPLGTTTPEPPRQVS